VVDREVLVAEFLSGLLGPLTGLISGALELFHSTGAPWWLSIVLLTVSVRAALLPLTVRQVRSMRAMQELRPEMAEIRARYEADRHKQQEAMMELYRKRRVNPLGGFLPVLVQLPVFVTMYQVVRGHAESFPSFANGGLLWFTDLTGPDPYFVLPVLSASLLIAAGEVSARNVDPSQRRMMRFLPVAFTALIARFPAGLFVYWVTSNAITLTQNLFIYRRILGKSSAHGPDEKRELPARGAVASSSPGEVDRAKGSMSQRAKHAGGIRRKRKKK
jgi:YidC/Oxa1 family membrane protein insertase